MQTKLFVIFPLKFYPMKKFLLFLGALAMVSTTLCAASLSTAHRADRKIDFKSPQQVSPRLANPSASALSVDYEQPSGEWTEWEPAGTGTLTLIDVWDYYYFAIDEYNGDFPGITVDHRQDAKNANIQQFRLNGILNDADVIIDYYPANQHLAKIRPQVTNVMDLSIMDMASAFESVDPDTYGGQEAVDEIVEIYNGYNYYVPEIGRFYIYLAFMAEGADDACGMGDLEFQFDGFADFTPQFDEATFYSPENKKIDITFDDGAAYARYGVFEGFVAQKMINEVLAGTEGIATIEKSATVELTDATANKLHNVIAVTFDENDTPLEWGYKYFTVVDDETGKWNSLGTTKVVSDVFEGVFGVEPSEIECEIQQNIANPGIYRLVNAFTSNYSYNDEGEYDTDYNHYLVIDATDPQMVLVDFQHTGNDWGGGYFALVSAASYNISVGKPDQAAQVAGKLADGKITFPKNGLLLWCPDWTVLGGQADAIYNANATGLTSIEIPSTDGIREISSENAGAPVRYYNLQGIEIQNPEAGSIIIVRRGNTAEKIVF